MIIIYYTECDNNFKSCKDCFYGENLCLDERCKYYEHILSSKPNMIYWSKDEHFLLIAQFLRRHNRIKDLQFVSCCDCIDWMNTDQIIIPIGDDGDFTKDPHHGFFNHRLKYLR